jgi:hypothetical protein
MLELVSGYRFARLHATARQLFTDQAQLLAREGEIRFRA